MFRRRTTLDSGLDAFERGDWRRARRLLLHALTEEESAIGSYHLGLLHWRGLGGRTDKHTAADYFARAAADGYPRAQTAYGIALRTGVGAPQDPDMARAHFRSAAGAGDGEAMVQLASMSEPDEAHHWLMRASELGYEPAMRRLADFLMQRDPVEALSWLYTDVLLSGDATARRRAAALAREMSAREIDAAQNTGRLYAKEIKDRLQRQR